jgi:two-component system OmpR family response regulator
MARALVIEDDDRTAEEIADELRLRGYAVVRAADGVEGLALAETGRFDVLTLDRMLPGIDGLSLVTRLREQGIHVPVLMISALSDVDERIAGLRAGGDDYLVKPFAPGEMATRVDVLLRRSSASFNTVLEVGAIRIDLIRREVMAAGAPVRLLPMEFKLLEFLARNPGQTISRQMLFEHVWGYYFDPGANLINVHVARLRKKLDRPGCPSAIVTIKGEGYRLDAV